ncbi:MAG TPA: Gfo/Idh/MocA family oxidoreductase [bacterium]|nr:Gfo/Idh/MocA family oxidoreductase [bacterium]
MRVGILGMGTAGARHLRAFRQIDGIELLAADPDAAGRRRAEAEGVRAIENLDALLARRPDAVVIAVPHASLATAGMRALDAGCHILIEKPMATTRGDAAAIVERGRRANLAIMVSFVHRFRPEVAAARSMIADGKIGRPRLVVDTMASGASEMPAWVWDRGQAGGGMMFYNGIHQVDRARFLMGDDVESVRADVRTLGYEVELEDTVTALLGFRSGGAGAIVQHKAPRAAFGGWETQVFGSDGSLHIRTGKELRWTAGGEAVTVPGEPEDRFLGAAREFVAAVREGRTPSPSGEDGLAALDVVLRMYTDSENRASVDRR